MPTACAELTALSDVRERIHSRANDYFVFGLGRWPKDNWRQFFGATDALLDATYALSGVGSRRFAEREHAILSCYGFLQALYIQQDAVSLIWRALGLTGNALADPRVREVRELRNRIAGHPARADRLGRGKRPSSAIINLHDVEPGVGFKAVIYYDGEMDVVDVSFAQTLAKNAAGLLPALEEAERAMMHREDAFRTQEAADPLAAEFERGLSYILEKLRCAPGDGRRDMALNMLASSLTKVEAKLRERGFWYDAAEYHVAAIRAGLELGERLTDLIPPARLQESWWVISEGIDSHARDLLRHVRALDDKLRAKAED